MFRSLSFLSISAPQAARRTSNLKIYRLKECEIAEYSKQKMIHEEYEKERKEFHNVRKREFEQLRLKIERLM